MAIIMSGIRRQFLISQALHFMVEILICYLLSRCFLEFEAWICSGRFDTEETYQEIIGYLDNPRIVLPIYFLVCSFFLFFAVLVAKFGPKGYIVFYFLWIPFCLIISSLGSPDSVLGAAVKSIANAFFSGVSLSLNAGMAMLCLVSVIFFALYYLIGRRQPV